MDNERFILWSTSVPLTSQIYRWENDARSAAEGIARGCRGAVIHVAKIIGSVTEPLPELKWSDGAAVGQPLDGGIQALSSAPRQDAKQTGYVLTEPSWRVVP